eukprot:gene12577-biopygen3424
MSRGGCSRPESRVQQKLDTVMVESMILTFLLSATEIGMEKDKSKITTCNRSSVYLSAGSRQQLLAQLKSIYAWCFLAALRNRSRSSIF